VEPLEITFYLSTPVALGFPWIYFDSLIAHIRLKEELGERYYSLPTKIPVDSVPAIPIKHWKDVPIASVSIFEPQAGLHTFSYFKRGDFPFPKGKISRASGFFKDFYLKTVYVPAVKVKFYATGELKEVERLVKLVPALGKERNIGFGFIRNVEVREVEHEWGLVKDSMAMRPIPVKYLKAYEDATYMAYKPPYWSKHSVDLCVVPFTRVELA
jgi:hypothetical protein